MNPPKIDICIEGYNVDQTDFYISYLIDKYNSCEQNYKNALAKISELEAENQKLRSDFLDLTDKISGNAMDVEILSRLKRIEKNLCSEPLTESDSYTEPEDKNETERLEFESKLKDFKSLLNF